MKLRIVNLNLLIDSIFLNLSLSLLHSLIPRIGLILFSVVERVRYAPLTALW